MNLIDCWNTDNKKKYRLGEHYEEINFKQWIDFFSLMDYLEESCFTTAQILSNSWEVVKQKHSNHRRLVKGEKITIYYADGSVNTITMKQGTDLIMNWEE